MLRPGTSDALFAYQREGVAWMRKQGSFLLADERGLGKSLQIISDFARIRAEVRPNARMLVVAPNQVMYKWYEEELPKWTTFSIEAATGTASTRTRAISAGADITVISYDNIARELELLNAQRFYYLVFDEAHGIKNHKALRTKAAFSLRGARRAMITGSPLLNRVDELWPLLFMIAPTEFPDYWRFVNRYAVYGGYEGRQIIGVQNVDELKARMAPFMLRRLQRDVETQRPPLAVSNIYYDLTPAQRRTYEQARKELKVEFEGQTIHEFDNPMTKFLRLRQICGTLAEVGGPEESGKLDAAMNLIMREIPRTEKIVVFGGSLVTLHALAARLREARQDVGVIAGKTAAGQPMSVRERGATVQAFQNTARPRILVASHGVAREGIDLYAAHYGVLLDSLWNDELQSQEYGRLDRTGQTHPVQFFKLLGNNTIDARVETILANKRATFAQVIPDEPDWPGLGLVREAWKELLAA